MPPKCLEDFLADEPIQREHQTAPHEEAALKLRKTRDRYTKKNKRKIDEGTGDTIIRAAVLDVFDQAIKKLKKRPDLHTQIASESTRKVKVILDIISAEPDDVVFTTAGQLLKPLEPQYAQPRIREFEDDEEQQDSFGHRVQHRLEAWRKEGWPDRYPRRAVRREKRKGERLIGKGRINNVELLARHVGKSNEELGGIVEIEEGVEDGDRASHTPSVRKRWDEHGKLVDYEDGDDSDHWD